MVSSDGPDAESAGALTLVCDQLWIVSRAAGGAPVWMLDERDEQLHSAGGGNWCDTGPRDSTHLVKCPVCQGLPHSADCHIRHVVQITHVHWGDHVVTVVASQSLAL